ncbi:MAG: outer membrane protein transport protein [Pseudohongiellaceae bacterium]
MRVVLLLCLLLPTLSLANDLIRLGGSARSQASANIAGLARDPISAITTNPAFLSAAGDSQQFNLSTLYVDSVFTSSLGERARADEGPGLLPEFAFSRQSPNNTFSWGGGAVIQSALRADFDLLDPPGTLGVSYGRQTHRSEFLVAKFSAAAYQVNSQLTIGAGIGLAYNRNQLQAPYIFQSHPELAGLKVLVDLDTDDVAATATIGMDYSLSESLSFNLAYTLETDFAANGELDGNLGQLGLGFTEDFSYDVRVSTAIPASLSGGLVWQASNNLQLAAQIDWIGWKNAFDELPLSLSKGSNADLNGFLGEDRIRDTAPLNWKDQRIVHFGGNYVLSNQWRLRAGYERSNVPVPRSTVTPMTAAILNEAFSVGTGIPIRSSWLDVAYRYTTADESSVVDSSAFG